MHLNTFSHSPEQRRVKRSLHRSARSSWRSNFWCKAMTPVDRTLPKYLSFRLRSPGPWRCHVSSTQFVVSLTIFAVKCSYHVTTAFYVNYATLCDKTKFSFFYSESSSTTNVQPTWLMFHLRSNDFLL